MAHVTWLFHYSFIKKNVSKYQRFSGSSGILKMTPPLRYRRYQLDNTALWHPWHMWHDYFITPSIKEIDPNNKDSLAALASLKWHYPWDNTDISQTILPCGIHGICGMAILLLLHFKKTWFKYQGISGSSGILKMTPPLRHKYIAVRQYCLVASMAYVIWLFHYSFILEKRIQTSRILWQLWRPKNDTTLEIMQISVWQYCHVVSMAYVASPSSYTLISKKNDANVKDSSGTSGMLKMR